jgi:hypothetical protein
MVTHTFYDDNVLVDFRYLVAVEPWDDEETDAPVYYVGVLLEVGHTPQRMSFSYPTAAQRDQALARLIAAHQAWEAFCHAPQVDDE